MMPSTAAIISFSPLHQDARVLRQIQAVRSICDVTAIGFTDPCIEEVRFVEVVGMRSRFLGMRMNLCEMALKALLSKARLYETAHFIQGRVRRAADVLRAHDFDLIVANDIDALPIALRYRGRAKVLFDAHEYSPRQYENWFLWCYFFQRYREYLCRTRIPKVDAMTTVGPQIAQEFAREFGVKPMIVQSAPVYHRTPYAPRDEDVIGMVHVGSAARYRQLEIMIEAMAQLDDRFRLDFMLVLGNSRYLSKLIKLASSDSRIGFVPPVAPDDIVERISGYDVGLCTYAPHSFNARYALPNKFFDAVQARLCIAIGPFPEMARLVESYGCGVVAEDFTSKALADTLRGLDRRKIEECRQAADVAARVLCYERSAAVLQNTVRRLLDIDGHMQSRGNGITVPD